MLQWHLDMSHMYLEGWVKTSGSTNPKLVGSQSNSDEESHLAFLGGRRRKEEEGGGRRRKEEGSPAWCHVESNSAGGLKRQGYDSVKLLGHDSGTECIVYNWDQVTNIREV